jgi:D-alanyl-D-alanine carboxypeptidase
MLFDRGFAMSPSGQSLAALPASAVTAPPNMRDEICRGRRKADMVALQEEFVASAVAQGSAPFIPGRGGAPMLAGAMEAPPSVAPAPAQKVAFDPVPVFVGPKPGWTGPVLAASSDDDEPAASPVSAYSAEKEAKPDVAASAPMALKSAVKPPSKLRRAHFTPQARARLAAAAKRVAQKPHRP